MTTDRSRKMRSTRKGQRLAARARAWVEATEAIATLMDARGINGVQLAKQLEVSAARVSQILSGEENLTLGTLSDVLFELESRLTFRVDEEASRVFAGMSTPNLTTSVDLANLYTWVEVPERVGLSWTHDFSLKPEAVEREASVGFSLTRETTAIAA